MTTCLSKTVLFRQLDTGRWFLGVAGLCGDQIKFPWVLQYDHPSPILGHYVLRTTIFDLFYSVEFENHG